MIAAGISWVLGFAFLAAPTLGFEAFDDLPRSPCLLLIWMALAGLPRARQEMDEALKPGWRAQTLARACKSLGLMGPLLCLAGALDYRAGVGSGPLFLTLGFGVGLALLLQLAAQRARRSELGFLRYGWAWFGCMLLLPSLCAVSGWDGSPGGGASRCGIVSSASPLDWIYGRALNLDFRWPIYPYLLVLSLVFLASDARRESPLASEAARP